MKEISLEQLNSALQPTPPPKPKMKEVSLEELQSALPQDTSDSLLSGMGKAVRQGGKTLKSMVPGLKLSIADNLDAEKREIDAKFAEEIKTAEAAGDMERATSLRKMLIERQMNTPERSKAKQQWKEQITTIQSEIQGLQPQSDSFWKNAAWDATASLTVMAPMIATAPLTGGGSMGPLLAMGLGTYANSYGKHRANNLLPEKASALAGVDGLVEVASELFPTMSLLKKTGVFRKTLETIFTDIPGEIVALYVQNATEALAQLGNNPSEQEVEEVLWKVAKETHKEVPRTIAATGMTVGVMAGATRGMQALTTKKEKPVVRPAEAEPKVEPTRGKPRIKMKPGETVEEAIERTKKTAEGEDILDLDTELPVGKQKGEVIDFKSKKEKQPEIKERDWRTLSEEEFNAELDRRLKEHDVKMALDPTPAPLEDIKQWAAFATPGTTLHDLHGPPPQAPRLTHDPMKDRRAEVEYERALRKWAGEELNPTEGSVRPLRALMPTDKVEAGETPLTKQFKGIHTQTSSVWELIANRTLAAQAKSKTPVSVPVDARQILSRMKEGASPAWQSLIGRLEQVLPDGTLVRFQAGDHLTYEDGTTDTAAGAYDPNVDKVYVRINGKGLSDARWNNPMIVRNVIHELWHAATYRYAATHPNAPAVKRMQNLYVDTVRAMQALEKELEASGLSQDEIRENLGGWLELKPDLKKGKTKVDGKDHLYGLTNPFELIAEAHSNPWFMQSLAKASPRAKGLWQKLKRIYHDVAGKVMEALGFNKADGDLLHQIFDATDDLLMAQAVEKHAPRGKKKKKTTAEKLNIPLPESQRFWEWFEGSQVVEENGSPQIVFHGTGHDFEAFDTNRATLLFFAADPEVSSEYALYYSGSEHRNLMPVFVKIKKPLIVNAGGVSWNELPLDVLPEAVQNRIQSTPWLQTSSSRTTTNNIAEAAKLLEAYDGVIFKNIKDGAGEYGHETPTTVYVAFKPTQVKSAIGNQGTWSEDHPSVLRANSPRRGPRMANHQLANRKSVDEAMALLTDKADRVPGVRALRTKVDEYFTQFKQTVAPETLGPKAVHSATILSKWIVNQMRNDASFHHQSRTRRNFWEANLDKAPMFIKAFEKNWKPKDPKFKEIFDAYREWNNRIVEEDRKVGITYELKDNYFFHIYKPKDRRKLAQMMERKYGAKFGEPGFSKERAYDLYEEAKAAGMEPMYNNPEDIMLARQHASEIAHMRVHALRELAEAGLAFKERPKEFETVFWKAPNGEKYFVHLEAAHILHNAWNTQSMWSREGLWGDAFRGAMYLKNRLVPIKLSLSLFHFFHVLTINNATGMLRATKGLLLGNISGAKFLKDFGKAMFYSDLISAPQFGGRIRAIFRGEIPPNQITPYEALAIQYMIEGGMLPEQSHEYKSNAKIAFRDAIRRARHSPWAAGRAAYELPFAALDWMQHWMFEKWIPSIKVASYLKEVQTALESDPSLIHDQQRRQIVFHKLAKSVDNRHGEMVYKTMFWNKPIKDLAVVNLLSLGWQMGFIREYGGGVSDLMKMPFKDGSLPDKIKAGQMDRAVFVTFYTLQSLMYGGLLTWWLTDEWPEEWLDYIYPKNGEKNPDGTDQRVNTMFYAREFSAISKHVENEGFWKGLSHLAVNKASGVFGLIAKLFTGVDSFGTEYRDPNGTKMEQLAQTVSYVVEDMTPISIGGIKREGIDPKTVALNIIGFSKAPGYATHTPTEAAIRQTWQKYNRKELTAYERALYSKDMRELREAFENRDMRTFNETLSRMRKTHDLLPKDVKRIQQQLRKNTKAEVTMFKSLSWQQQKRLLDKMTPIERQEYIRHANKAHVRYRYKEPRDE